MRQCTNTMFCKVTTQETDAVHRSAKIARLISRTAGRWDPSCIPTGFPRQYDWGILGQSHHHILTNWPSDIIQEGDVWICRAPSRPSTINKPLRLIPIPLAHPGAPRYQMYQVTEKSSDFFSLRPEEINPVQPELEEFVAKPSIRPTEQCESLRSSYHSYYSWTESRNYLELGTENRDN